MVGLPGRLPNILEYSSVPFKAHSSFAFYEVNPNLADIPMTTSTENSSPDEETQTTSNLPGLHEKRHPEPSNNEPEALGGKPQAEYDSGGDPVSSAVLPVPKARSIALVATVTGATFLNVNLHQFSLTKLIV